MIKVGESRSINVHGGGDDQSHDPGGDDHDDGRGPLPLGHVVDGVEDGVESVKTDANETVDAGGTEGHICRDRNLARWNSPEPASVLIQNVFFPAILNFLKSFSY